MVKEQWNKMMILSRISILPDGIYTREMDEQINYFIQKYSQYVLDESMKLMLIPIDINAYVEIKEFINANQKYYNDLFEIYENKFNKKELEQAQVFEMRVANVCCGYGDMTTVDYFDLCCKHGELLSKQIKDYEVSPREWRKREMSFSDLDTFLVSDKLKCTMESARLTNLSFRPVWQRKDKNVPIAYQIEVNQLLPSLKELNGWEIYKICPFCGKEVFEPNIKGQICITKEMYNNLEDFNGTSEEFAELSSRIYLVSRRVYQLFKDYGVKGMKFEPVMVK
jgi:hypothetical protein